MRELARHQSQSTESGQSQLCCKQDVINLKWNVLIHRTSTSMQKRNLSSSCTDVCLTIYGNSVADQGNPPLVSQKKNVADIFS